jgi:hypothetical protein
LEATQLFIPILTPSLFQSDFCRREAKAFLYYEARARRDDLILPIYLINASVLENASRRLENEIARVLRERQHDDWRLLSVAFQHSDTRWKAAEKIHDLAKTIAAAAEKNAEYSFIQEMANEVTRRIEADEAAGREVSVEEGNLSPSEDLIQELEAARAEVAELKRQ